jgi:hypothetical protein
LRDVTEGCRLAPACVRMLVPPVRKHRSMRCLLVLVAVCSSAPAPPAAVANVKSAPPRSELAIAIDELARIELERYVADPKTLPDGGLLDAPYVRVEVPVTVGEKAAPAGALTAAALPAGATFELETGAELQAEADRTGHNVGFVGVSLIWEPPGARVGFGVDIAIPTKNRGAKLCCCTAYDVFERRAGRWRYRSRNRAFCG